MGVLEPAPSRRSSNGYESDGVSRCSSDYQCLPSDILPDLAKMSSVNLDHCQETHVGPKINFSIVLNGGANDSERVLRPINRILDNEFMRSPPLNEYNGPLPSAPYESESEKSWPTKPLDDPVGGNEKKVPLWPRKLWVLGVCAAILIVGTGAVTGLYWFDWRTVSSATNNTSPAPPTITPPNPVPTSSGPTSSPSISSDPTTSKPTSTSISPRPVPTSPPTSLSPSTDDPWPPYTYPPIPIPRPGGQTYEDWGQIPPSWDFRRPAMVVFRSVAVDNLAGDRCAYKEECVDLLKEAESGASLNYNFLIDDSGNVYYARGFRFDSDNDLEVAKVAFIGSYTSTSHLTHAQSSALYQLISDNPKKFSADFRVEAQCMRGISGDTGPDKNVMCDLVSALRSKLKYPVQTVSETTLCPWKMETARAMCDG